VKVVDSETNVYKNFPHEVLDEMCLLLLNVAAEVMVLAVLHHDVDEGVLDEAVEVTNNKVRVESRHQLDLHQSLDCVCLFGG